MVAPQKRLAETADDAGAKKVKFDKSSQFKKNAAAGKFDGKKSFGKPGMRFVSMHLHTDTRAQVVIFHFNSWCWCRR